MFVYTYLHLYIIYMYPYIFLIRNNRDYRLSEKSCDNHSQQEAIIVFREN
jgi:hypothetical protein